MKELRNLCVAVIVVAGVLNISAAIFASPNHPATAFAKTDLSKALAVNP